MILLCEDGKSIVIIDSWDDVIGRPGLELKVNPNEVKLKQIIGRYNISPKQPCGISTCCTPHNMGYLVVCEGGIEINIGNKCGKNFFGVDFKTLENTFRRDTNTQRYRENIKTFQNRIKSFENKITILKKGEKQGDWCYEKMHWQVNYGFEQKTLDALNRRAKRGDNSITKEVQLTEREKEIARETGNTENYRVEVLGVINGLSAVTKYKKLRSLLNVRFGEDVDSFNSLSPDDLDLNELKRWHNWVNQFEKRIYEADDIILECNRFLLQSNLDEIRRYKHIL